MPMFFYAFLYRRLMFASILYIHVHIYISVWMLLSIFILPCFLSNNGTSVDWTTGFFKKRHQGKLHKAEKLADRQQSAEVRVETRGIVDPVQDWMHAPSNVVTCFFCSCHPTRWVVAHIFLNFHPYLGKMNPILTSIFFNWVETTTHRCYGGPKTPKTCVLWIVDKKAADPNSQQFYLYM